MDETSEPNTGDVRAEDTTVADAAAGEVAPKALVSRTTLVVSVLIALIVAGVAGVAIGWKVEQQRVKEDVENVRPIGTVTAIDDDSVTIELETASGSKTYEITDDTTVDGTGEMEEGATVLIRSSRGDGDQRQATRIVVLGGQGSEETSG